MLIYGDGRVEKVQPSVENCLTVSSQVRHRAATPDPAILLLGMRPREIRNDGSQKDSHKHDNSMLTP